MKRNKIETLMKCPTCGTEIDVLNIKEAIKHRFDLEFDEILERL